nr:hypothetical protein [Zea mays]
MLCAHGPEVEWLICTIWEARPSPSQFLRNRLTRNRRGNSTSTPHSFPVPILSPLKSLPVPPAWQPVRSMPHKNLCGDGRSLLTQLLNQTTFRLRTTTTSYVVVLSIASGSFLCFGAAKLLRIYVHKFALWTHLLVHLFDHPLQFLVVTFSDSIRGC